MSLTQEELSKKIQNKKDWVTEIYHELHRIPELGMEERETTEFLCRQLSGLGIHPLRLDPTGVTAYIGPSCAYTIALRADIDGLMISEDTNLPFSSIHSGKMHACGHDGHMAGLLGAASVLKEMERNLTVRVKLIFQPSEENTKGAKHLISQGILDDVDAIFGLHLFSDMKTGEISIEPGARMAQTDRFSITFYGKGGHAAKPHQCVDATVMAADFVMSAQTIVSREVDPVEGAVVTVGRLKSGTQYNIISGKAVLEGTCRSYSERAANLLNASICRRAEAVADGYGGNVKIFYEQGSHPPVVNDKEFSRAIAKQAAPLLTLWERSLIHVPPLMLGEDFSWYQREVPGVFAFVGCGAPGRKCYPNHHPKFVIEESALCDAALLHLAAVRAAEKK